MQNLAKAIGLCVSFLCIGKLINFECPLPYINKLSEYPGSCHDKVFCCGVCCQWHGKEGLDVQAIRDERTKLLTFKKKDLVKGASAAQVRVAQRINVTSWQISKPMMVRRLVVARFGTGVEEAAKPAAKTIHDKFCL